MFRVLLIIGGLLVGLLTALFTVPAFVDWTRYRGVFEEEASRLIGRDVRVSGRVNLRILPTPFMRFEQVRIADTQGTIGEPLFRADDFTVWLAVGALFRGEFEATEIELRKPVLTLVLDDRGGGNWTALADRRTASFVPSRVKLDTLQITNGSIAVFGSKGDERARFDRINGELSAETLSGPYRVTAAFASGGKTRDIRLSTAAALDDGSFRVKGTVRGVESSGSVTLDATVHDFLQRVRLEGEVTARLPVPTAAPQAAPALLSRLAPTDQPEGSIIDLKSSIKADTAGVDWSDLALSYEQEGRPQLASGTARLEWRDRTALRIDLQSRWLDLDRLAGPNAGPPLQIARQLASGFDDILPANGTAQLSLEVDQATVGGDVVSRLATRVVRSGDTLALEAFSAVVPGGSRLNASGVLSGRGPHLGFNGEVGLRGASLTRFLGWAIPPVAGSEPRRDGPFSLSGHIQITPQMVSGRGLAVQFAGSTLTGDASVSHAPDRRISLVLEGAELDVTPMLEGAATPAAAVQALTRHVDAIAAQTEKSTTADRAEILLRLRVGRLIAGATVVRDVATDIRLADGHLTMPLLRLGREESWSVELRGDVAGFMRPAAKGAITAFVTAETPQGLAELAELVNVGGQLEAVSDRGATLLPLRLSGRLRLGERADGTLDLTVEGATGAAGRLAGSLLLDKAAASWRERRADLAVTVENSDFARLLAPLLTNAVPPAAVASASPTRLVVRAIGTMKHGLATFGALDTAGLSSEVRGKLTWADSVGFDGDLRVQARDVGRALLAATGKARTALDAVPAVGTMTVVAAAGKMRLETSRLVVGAAEISGKLDVSTGEGGTWRVDGDMATDRLSLPLALSLFTDGHATRVAGTSAAADSVPWTEDSFDMGPLGSLESRVRLSARTLDVAPGIALRSARLDLTAKASSLQIGILEGEILQGKVGGSLRLEALPGGARLSGEVTLRNGRLEAAVAGGVPPLASGSVGLRFDIDSTASSPRGLMTALRGKGDLTLSEAQSGRLSPTAVRAATQSMVAIGGEQPAAEWRRRLVALAVEPQPPLPIGRRTLAIEIKEGSARLAPLIIDSGDGRMTGMTTVDIEGMRIDSEWRIEAKAPASSTGTAVRTKADLPPVTYLWAGPIGSLDSRAPRLESAALEQEISVRRIEREVEELERLRREDQEHMRKEIERQQRERERIEAERQPVDLGRPGAPAPWPPQSATVQQPTPATSATPPALPTSPWAAIPSPPVAGPAPEGPVSSPALRIPSSPRSPPAQNSARPLGAEESDRLGQ